MNCILSIVRHRCDLSFVNAYSISAQLDKVTVASFGSRMVVFGDLKMYFIYQQLSITVVMALTHSDSIRQIATSGER